MRWRVTTIFVGLCSYDAFCGVIALLGSDNHGLSTHSNPISSSIISLLFLPPGLRQDFTIALGMGGDLGLCQVPVALTVAMIAL